MKKGNDEMKKFGLVVSGIVFISLALGLYYKSTYTDYNFSDEKYLEKLDVVNWFSGEDFGMEEMELSDNANSEMTIEITDINTGELIDSMVLDGDSVKIDEEVKALDTQIKDELMGAQIVLIVTGLGEIENLAANIQQKVIVEEVIKGDESITNKEIFVVGSGDSIYIDDTYMAIGSKVNFMKKDQRYIIFLEQTNKRDVYMLKDMYGVAYFNLDDVQNNICSGDVSYSDVKDNEFFVTDELALENLVELKVEVINYFMENDN